METTERIVFLGDSITDGHTYALLIQQALRETGQPTPVGINAGIGGDTAKGMRARLDRDVLPHRPTLVMLSAGINDVLQRVPAADYAADVTAIADRLDQAGIPLLVFTTTILGPQHQPTAPLLAQANTFLRQLAMQRGYPVADIHEAMRTATAAGADLLDPDQVHLNFAGYRVMTRAILDALGQATTPVPAALSLAPLPGLIRDWRIRPVEPADSPWQTLTLPETRPIAHWWQDHERQRGFAMSLQGAYQAEARLDSTTAREGWFNTGAQLQTVTVNGTRIYTNAGWTGWHAGKERIKVELRAGPNQIEITTTGPFFLSETDSNTW